MPQNTVTLLVPLTPALARHARRLALNPGEAEDIVQDTLLILCQQIRRGARIDDPSAYAHQVLRRRAKAGWRKPKMEELEEDMASTDPLALPRLECADALAAIAKLPTEQRDLMELVVQGETSRQTMAKMTGLPLGTVNSRLARARAHLRQTLDCP